MDNTKMTLIERVKIMAEGILDTDPIYGEEFYSCPFCLNQKKKDDNPIAHLGKIDHKEKCPYLIAKEEVKNSPIKE